jgi:hypothetical protein
VTGPAASPVRAGRVDADVVLPSTSAVVPVPRAAPGTTTTRRSDGASEKGPVTMTAATTTSARPVPGEARRVLALARVQAFYWKPQLGSWVLVVVVGLAVLVLLRAGGSLDPGVGTAALAGLCVGSGAVHSQTILHLFPFALGLGATRRTFVLATALVAAVQAAVQATVLTLLVQLELLTGGWGLSVRLTPGALRGFSVLEQWAVLAAAVLLAAQVFVFGCAVFKRWGWPAVWVIGGSYLVLFPVIVIAGSSLVRSGVALPDVSSSPVLAGGPLALAVVLGLAGWAALRRATP